MDAFSKTVTRLVIFEADPSSGERAVFDIVEWDGHLTLPDIVKELPKRNRRGFSAKSSREYWKERLREMGTPDFPFVIEHARR